MRAARLPRRLAHALIRLYQLTLSSLIGRQCRFEPSCSAYADQAIQAHGLWAGGWMGAARICRCRPGGDFGFDPVAPRLPLDSRWYKPWRFGRWRPIVCEPVDSGQTPT